MQQGAETRGARKAVFYSALVLPGLGQWVLGKRVWGALFMVIVIGLVLWLAARIFALVYVSMVPSGDLSRMRINPETVSQVHREAYLQNWWLLMLIAVIWIWSIVDALMARRKMRDNKTGNE